jgi:hypothetical protein
MEALCVSTDFSTGTHVSFGVLNLLFASTSAGANRSYCGSSYTSTNTHVSFVVQRHYESGIRQAEYTCNYFASMASGNTCAGNAVESDYVRIMDYRRKPAVNAKGSLLDTFLLSRIW